MVTQIAILLKSTNSINRNTLKAGWVRVRNVLASFDEVPKDPTQGQKSPAMGIQIALLLNTKNSFNRNTLKATMNRGGLGSATSWLLSMKSQRTQGQKSPAMGIQIALLLNTKNSFNRNTLKATMNRGGLGSATSWLLSMKSQRTQGQKSPAMGIQIALLLNTKNSLNRNTLKATMNRGGSGSAMSWLLWMKSQKTQGQRSPAMVTQIVILVNTTNIKAHRNTFFGLIYSILVPINHHHHHHQSQHHLLEIFWKWTTISNFSDVFIRQKSNKHLIRSSFIPLSTLLIPSQK